MTTDEVRRCIDTRGLIECGNVRQRGEAIQFLLDIGYELHPGARRWLEKNPDNAEFLHPGLDDSKPDRITCWRWIDDKQTIPFEDIEVLIAQNDTPIDERSSAEFSEAFAALMS